MTTRTPPPSPPSPPSPPPGAAASIEPERLQRIIAAASGRLDLTEMVQRLAALVTEVTASELCLVHMVEPDRNRIVLSGATPPFDVYAGDIELAWGEGVAGWVAQNAQAVVIDDKWTDPRYKYIPELRGEDYASLASAPMITRAGHVVGVVNVHSRDAHHFRPEDVSILADVANLMADAVENARLHTRLAEREAELERFAERTLELHEAERQRLAAEIHDGISQRIVSLNYFLCAAADSDPSLPVPVVALIDSARHLAAAALDEARMAVNGLRPPLLDDLGLGACLRKLAAELPAGIAREVDVEDLTQLDGHVEVAIYRMAQEVLQNVLKHADAHLLTLTLRSEASHCTLTISDDGRGFDPDLLASAPERGGYGLVGLRARAALIGAGIDVVTAPGRGTTVSIIAPLLRA